MQILNELTDTQLLHLIDWIDREEFLKGTNIKNRGFRVAQRVINECGGRFSLGVRRSPGLDRVLAGYQSFYRTRDTGAGAVNAGLAVHLDIFFRVHVPIVFGRLQINPFDWTDMTDMQKARLNMVQQEEEEVLAQIIDVVDIGFTLRNNGGFQRPPDAAAAFFSMAAFHNQAAAAICISAFDLRGAIMASLLCAELSAKSLSLASEATEDELTKKVGHNIQNSRPYLERLDDFDLETFLLLAKKLPHFVKSRYEDKDWSRCECAEIVLSAQKMLAMAARHFAKNSISRALVQPS